MDNYIAPQSDYQYSSMNDSEYNDEKEKIIKDLELNPNVVLISPDTDSFEELNRKFNSFGNLSEKNKRFSNEYSLQLYGLNIPNMYTSILNRLKRNHDETIEEQFIAPPQTSIDAHQVMDSALVNGDVLGLYGLKLEQFNPHPELPKYFYNYMDQKWLNENITKKDFSNVIPDKVPYFTIDEMDEFATECKVSEYDNYLEWFNDLNNVYNNFTLNPTEENAQEVINMGWNPSVNLNEKNMKFARKRQIAYFESHHPEIIDISHLAESSDISEEVITEASKRNKNLYEQKGLYPVYIVMTFTYTPFGTLIRLTQNSMYSHAGMSLDSNLQEIYTFNFGKNYNGFTIESIEKYKKAVKASIIDVLCIFVDKQTHDDIKDVLHQFAVSKNKTRYGFGNIINILFKRAKEFPYPENLNLVCSQFVDTVLKLCKIDLVNKPTNLVLPQDFAEISKNPKVYKVYEGHIREYSEKKAESNIRALFASNRIKNIKYNDKINIKLEETQVKEQQEVINQIRDMLTPESVIYRRSIL